MIKITPTLTSTGSAGNVKDALQAINARFDDTFLKHYDNLSLLSTANIYTLTYNAAIDEVIEYGTTEVYLTINKYPYLVGIPDSLIDLVNKANLLDIGYFYLNDDDDIEVRSFQTIGDFIQNNSSVFRTTGITDTNIIPTQADINRELALLMTDRVKYSDLEDYWGINGSSLTAPGRIGSTNNQPVSIIVDGVDLLEFKVNGTFHRNNKLWSASYSATSTSIGSGAMTDWEDSDNNSAFGGDALSKVHDGISNTGIGYNSLHKIVDEDYNTGIGSGSGGDLETGGNNFFGGYNAGDGLVTGNAMTFAGAKSGSTDGLHSSIALGYNAQITANNQLAIGAEPDGSGYGAVNHIITYYVTGKTHGFYFRETSPQGSLAANRGSIAFVNDGSDGTAWLKVGATTSSWEQIQTTAALEITNREIVYGTGTSITSSPDFTFNDSTGRMSVNGNIYVVDTGAVVTDSVMKFQNSASSSFLYLSDASPLSVITAARSSIALVDTGSLGQLFIKRTTTGTGGWARGVFEGDTGVLSFTFLSGEGIDTDSGGAAILNLGVVNNKVLNIGTGSANTNINIGTSGTNVIVIGNSNSTISFVGSVINENVTNLNVSDKLITLNDGGAAASGTGVGFEIEENAAITGYIKTTGGRDGYLFRAPANAADSSFILSATSGRTYTFPDVSGNMVTTGDTGTVTDAMLAGSISDGKISSAATWSAKGYDLSAQCANGITLTNGVTNYVAPFFGNSSNATETNRQLSIKVTTTCSRLYIRTSTSQPASGSLVVTVRKNAADTAITLTIAAGTAAGTFTDLVNTVGFTAGDLLSIKIVNNATTTSATIMEVGVFMQ